MKFVLFLYIRNKNTNGIIFNSTEIFQDAQTSSGSVLTQLLFRSKIIFLWGPFG